jgi:hypothetical protein
MVAINNGSGTDFIICTNPSMDSTSTLDILTSAGRLDTIAVWQELDTTATHYTLAAMFNGADGNATITVYYKDEKDPSEISYLDIDATSGAVLSKGLIE